jgi:hypothetical protein
VQERRQHVYVSPLREDVVRPTLASFESGAGRRWPMSLRRSNRRFVGRFVEIDDLETDEAVRVLLDVTNQVFRFYPDALADKRPPDDIKVE